MGRAAYPAVIEAEGFDYVSTSAIGLRDRTKVPRALTTEEVKEYVQLFATAAKNAVAAGFDGSKRPRYSTCLDVPFSLFDS